MKMKLSYRLYSLLTSALRVRSYGEQVWPRLFIEMRRPATR
jgi:hypothetical protein